MPLSGDSPRARKRDIQIMEWALQTGELRDPDNAFWPTMRATAYFAANRDKEALAALARASRKSEWNAYIHEEVLGQWRLYSAAYGDNGAAQKIAPLSLVAFRTFWKFGARRKWPDGAPTAPPPPDASTTQ